MGAADHEAPGRINIKLSILIHQFPGDHLVKHILFNIGVDLLLGNIIAVLGGKHYRIQANRPAILIIFHRHLRFPVGTQIRKDSVLTHLSQLPGQLMGQGNGIRHIFFRFIGSKAEHHALIPGADGSQLFLGHPVLLRLQRLVHAHGNIRGLLIYGGDYPAGIAVKTVLCAIVPNFPDGFPHYLLQIHISLGSNFSHHQNQPGGNRRLAGYAAHGILLQHSIQHRIRNLIAHFVRMAFRYRLRSEK